MRVHPLPERTKTRDFIGLAGFAVVCLAVSAIGGAITSTTVDTWYQEIAKPRFNPPDWVFAPVWTTLYILIAIAGWRVWRSARTLARSLALVAYAIQLVLNLAWSFLFFGLRRIDLALIEIFVLLVAIVFTSHLFWKIDRPAAAMFIPYVIWVAYATALNFELWRLN